MLVTFVAQSSISTNATTVNTITINYIPAPGNWVILILGNSGATANLTCVDSNGNPVPLFATVGNAKIFIGQVPTGAVASYTCSWTGTARTASLMLAEYTNVVDNGNTSAVNSGTSTTPNSTLVTTQPNSTVISVFFAGSNNNFSQANTGSTTLRGAVNGGALAANSLAIGDNGTTPQVGTSVTGNATLNNVAWSATSFELFPPITEYATDYSDAQTWLGGDEY